MLHLAIFSPGYIEKIFSGQKTLDGRFSEIKCAPYNQVEKRDLVLMKKSGGPIIGFFTVGKVDHIEIVKNSQIQSLIKKYENELALDKEFIKRKLNAKFVSLIEIKRPTKFRMPVAIKKRSLSGWVTLGVDYERQLELF